MKPSPKVSSVICYTMKKQKCLSFGIVCTVLGAIVAALLPPLILGNVIDLMTLGKAVPLSDILLYFGFTALAGLAESMREGLLIVFGQKITHVLRGNLMDKYTRLTADELTHQEPGAVVSRFVGDVNTVEKLFTSGIVSMVADACKIISILAVIWFRNRGLAILLVVLLPFLFLFTRVVQKNMLAAQMENRRAVSRASGHVPETIHNIRTIQNLDKETYMEEQYDKYIGESYRAVEKTNFFDAVYSPVVLILNAVTVAVVMIFSASGNPMVLSLFGMSAGTAATVISYISQIFRPVETLGMEIQTIQSAIAGVHRINEFFRLEELSPKEEYAGNARISATKTQERECPFVEFHKVTFAYQDRDIFKDLSFQVEEGEQITLSGRTGAGKSTIFKLLLGLYEPKTGTVQIQGEAASEIPDDAKRKLFGYVEQTFHMVPGTIREQITLYDNSITMEEVRAASKLVGLDDAIMSLEQGYDTMCSQEIFSQGQWQLLSIARAAVAKPRILLLDEITANLDAQTEKEVLQALRRVSADRTVISISHRVHAKNGRVIAVDSIMHDDTEVKSKEIGK